MLQNIKYNKWVVMAFATLLLTSCKKEYSDPNRATSDKVLSTANYYY